MSVPWRNSAQKMFLSRTTSKERRMKFTLILGIVLTVSGLVELLGALVKINAANMKISMAFGEFGIVFLLLDIAILLRRK